MNRFIKSSASAVLVLFGLSVLVFGPFRANAAEVFIRPINGITTLRFGASYLDAGGRTRGHHGIDINATEGTAVVASAPGKVVFTGSTPNGTCVSIIHPGAIRTTYLPLKAAKVSKGDTVQAGRLIGYVGDSADPSGKTPHLHMGAIFAGEYIDPESLFRGEFKPDLSKVIRRGDIPPIGGAGSIFPLKVSAAIGAPGFFSWLWDKTVLFFEWLAGGASGLIKIIISILTKTWAFIQSIAVNTLSFLWDRVVRFSENLFKLAGGIIGFPTKTAIGFIAPADVGSPFAAGNGAGIRIIDPSGDAATPGNEVSFRLVSRPARVEVFNADGESVWRLDALAAQPGAVFWTGIDNCGRVVANGIYTVIIEYADRTEGFLVEVRWHS